MTDKTRNLAIQHGVVLAPRTTFGIGGEAEFFGEPRPKGIVGSILAPGGGVVRHVDRFILPSLAQVEYALGPYSHLMISNYLSPINRDVTRMFTEIGFRLPVGGGAVKRIVMPLAKRIADDRVGKMIRASKMLGQPQNLEKSILRTV